MFSEPSLSLQIPPQHDGRQQLADAERAPNPPSAQHRRTLRDPQQRESRCVIKQRDETAGAWQIWPRREHADAKTDRPEAWQKRHQRGTQVSETHGNGCTARDARQKLAEYLPRPPSSNRFVADHVVVNDLTRPDQPGEHRDGAPIDHEPDWIRDIENGWSHPRRDETDQP